MKRKPLATTQHAQQLGFDFDAVEEVFEDTIETINRIQTNTAIDTPDLFEGINHVNRPIETTGIRTEGSQSGHIESSDSQPIHTPGMENTGPVGIQQPGETSAARSARGDSLVESAVRPTELGAADSGSSRGGDSGSRGAGDEPRPDRAHVKPTNYAIGEHDRLGQGGSKSKFRDNVAALSLVQTLKAENRSATRQEQAVLVKYVGWGGMPQAFDHRNTEWQAEFQQLSGLLPKDEYEAARRSTQDAHYTAQPVIEAIYTGLERIGFKGGKLLEPSLGTGHFVGLLPASIRDKTKVTGIELDPTTAAIATHLYPSATVINKGLQEVAIPPSYFDVVVGNPPFGNQSVFDPNHRDISEFSIHNYFLAKSLDKVREEGIVAVVVSSFFNLFKKQ